MVVVHVSELINSLTALGFYLEATRLCADDGKSRPELRRLIHLATQQHSRACESMRELRLGGILNAPASENRE